MIDERGPAGMPGRKTLCRCNSVAIANFIQGPVGFSPNVSHAKAGNINHALRHLATLPSPPDSLPCSTRISFRLQISPATVFIGPTESPAVMARKGPHEFAISLIGDGEREALTRRVYSECYGKPFDTVRPTRVLTSILQRLAR